MRYFAILLACFVGLSSVAQAATLNESDIPGGFSNDFTSPTQVAGAVSYTHLTLPTILLV